MKKEIKIGAIYETITSSYFGSNTEENEDFEFIMIGDVLDYLEDKFTNEVKVKLDILGIKKKNMYRFQHQLSSSELSILIQNDSIRHNYNLKNFEILLNEWELKRKPIELQLEECIEYIYNLIK